MKTSSPVSAAALLTALLIAPSAVLAAQTAAAGTAQSGAQTAAPRQSGTVKAVTPSDLVLTNAAGQDFAVNLPPSAKVLLVDPVTRDVKNAQPGSIGDIAAGDKAIVSGTAGDAGQTLNATRILLLKSGAIAAMHEQEQAAWARSLGGIVKAKDAASGALTVANGARTYTINTTPQTVVRRYAAGSVRFEDAVKSNVDAVQPGDQVQARGQRSPDGATVTADEIVTGSFSNFSGTLSGIDASAGTVTLKDLATKRQVTVLVTPQTNVRKLPAGFGAGMAARGGAGTAAGAQGRPAGSGEGTGAGNSAQGSPAAGAREGAAAGGRRPDLSRILNRLPTETLGELKQGDAVMIVASNAAGGGQPTAITLLSGVEQILASSPAGQTTLSPWSLGGGGGEGEGGGEGGGAGSAH